MKKYLLYFTFCALLILSWCWDSQDSQSWTWDVLSWDINEEIQELSWGTTQEETVEPEATENEQTVEEGTWAEVWSWEEVEVTPARQAWFWVEECNKIIDFNLCVISKAPIENQELMKESLQKAVEPWKLLANAQLREVCQKTIEKDTFKEVVAHYEALDNWCKY